MTLGFLELMRVMADSPVPGGLGAGYRAPGFDPYLHFLRDSIFLKFNTRAYKNQAERVRKSFNVQNFLESCPLVND